MRKLVSILALTVAMSGPALAGDWTGPYAGIGVGWADVDGPGALDGNDVTYGAHVGYDYDFGDFVLGGELEWDRTDISLGGGAANTDNVGRLKVRFGYDFGPALGYLVAGGAKAYTSMGNDTGAVYGLGVAWAVDEQITVSGEFLRHDFNNFNGLGADVDANTFNLRVSFRF